jgi:hypothetical protein
MAAEVLDSTWKATGSDAVRHKGCRLSWSKRNDLQEVKERSVRRRTGLLHHHSDSPPY